MAASRTSYELDQEHTDMLKAVAGALGFYQTRGPGTGTVPNISAMLRALAEVDEKTLVAGLRKLGVEGKK